MKLFRHSRVAQRVSQWLVPIMVAPLLVYYAPPTTAADAASSASPASSGDAGRIPAVVVLDFNNNSGYNGALTGRNAAAAVSQAMNDSDAWDVLSTQQVSTALTNLGLTPPLDLTAMQQLGRAVEADSVVLGQVYAVTTSENPRQAQVGLRVEMREVSSGELINGAIVTAKSGVRPGFSGDAQVLVDEAMRKAAFDAVQTMSQNKLPRGTVLNTQVTGSGAREVLLNIGAQNGVREGMEFIVNRSGTQVSRLRIVRVEADQSTASVVSGTAGAQPEDVVTAVFSLPSVDSVQPNTVTGEIPTPKAKPKGSRKKGFTSALGAILGIGLLVALLSGGSKSGRLTGSGSGNTPAAQATSVNQDPFVSFPGSAVRVSWSVPNNVREQDIVQFTIVRSDLGNAMPAGIAGPGERFFIDGEYVRDLTYQTLNTGGGGTGNTGGTTGLNTVTTEDIRGLIPGRPVTYQIFMIYRRPVANQTTTTTGDTGTGTGTGTGTTGTDTTGTAFTYAETPIINTTAATPVPPPTLISPVATNTEPIEEPTAAEFIFQPATQGVIPITTGIIPPVENPFLINQAMIEFSLDPTFTNVKQVNLTQLGGSQGGQPITTRIDITRLFPNVHNRTIFWHAGVRAANDQPGPYPGRFSRASGSNDRRWIYSEVESFIIP